MAQVRESPLGTRRVVQTGIKIIKIIYNEPGKQSEDQYGGDPSENVGPPFPPVIDQYPVHGLRHYPGDRHLGDKALELIDARPQLKLRAAP